MKNRITQETLKSIAYQIGKNLNNVEKVILFGSHAWGKPAPDSDIDLLVVMRSKKRPIQRAQLIYNLLFPPPYPIDIMVRTPLEIKKRLSMGDFFIRDIMDKGKVLYE